MNKQNIIEILKTGVHSVSFIKTDSTERTLICTLDSSLIPNKEIPEEKRKHTVSEDIIPVYVPELGGWRSFRVDSFVGFNVEGES